MPTQQEITLSIIKLEGDMVKNLAKASKLDRVGRWKDAETYLQNALADLLKIGVLESDCEGVVKEAESGLDGLLVGEFEFNEFVDIEFTQNVYKSVCQ